MAFNKVSVVAFVLLVVAATAYARPDAFDDSSAGLGRRPMGDFCSSCECKGIIGRTCVRTDSKVGSCPFRCGGSCVCDKSAMPTCLCSYKVETCNPRACGNAQMTLLELATFAQEN